jgi:hypothetical protein
MPKGWWSSTRGLPVALKALVLGFIGIATTLGVTSWLEHGRRTAEAPIELVVLDSNAQQHPFVNASIDVRYRFEAGGTTWEFTARRAWSIETIRAAKVCYDPVDPANQSLVEASEQCG